MAKGLGFANDENKEERSYTPAPPLPPPHGKPGRRVEQQHEQWKRGGAAKKFLTDARRDLDERKRRGGGSVGRQDFEQWQQEWVDRRFEYHEEFDESAARDMLNEYGR